MHGLTLQSLFGGATTTTSSGGTVCDASAKNAQACDFSRAVLASTEDVWKQEFAASALPNYGQEPPSSYALPTLVVFAGAVGTGCGNATAAVGPFYCPTDGKLYIDPSFYDDLAQTLKSPGDFAQAYVIAHEVGHRRPHTRSAMTRSVTATKRSSPTVPASSASAGFGVGSTAVIRGSATPSP